MNTQTLTINPLLSVNHQARFLMSTHRLAQRHRRLSLLQRATEEIGHK
jgi:hypothetical protein